MAGESQTTKQKERDDAKEAEVGDLFTSTFDEIESTESETTESTNPGDEEEVAEETNAEETAAEEDTTSPESETTPKGEEDAETDDDEQPSGAPPVGGPPTDDPPSKGPPSGPPTSGPPTDGPPSKGPPSGPPTSGPPTDGPPSKGPPSDPPTSGPPTDGPPSKGPPSDPPPSTDDDNEAPTTTEEEIEDDVVEDDSGDKESDKAEPTGDEFSEELLASVTHSMGNNEIDSDDSNESTSDVADDGEDEEDVGADSKETTVKEPESESTISDSDRVKQLEFEVARLRGGLSGAAEVIQEIENPPMPPVVGEDFVIPGHLVSDFVRLGRQLHREELVKATQGAIAILDPDQPGLVHSTSKSCALGQATELDIVSGRLGQAAPPGAPDEWRVMEILIAATSLHNGGPAACIHVQPPYATTVALEKDRIVLQPIDHYGKENLGKAVIVDPDFEDMDEYLRQVAEALQQGNMKCVVIRGLGIFAVGRNFNEAWHWAATLEHSMQVLLLSRQAGMKT